MNAQQKNVLELKHQLLFKAQAIINVARHVLPNDGKNGEPMTRWASKHAEAMLDEIADELEALIEGFHPDAARAE